MTGAADGHVALEHVPLPGDPFGRWRALLVAAQAQSALAGLCHELRLTYGAYPIVTGAIDPILQHEGASGSDAAAPDVSSLELRLQACERILRLPQISQRHLARIR